MTIPSSKRFFVHVKFMMQITQIILQVFQIKITYNFNADSPDWKILDAPVSNIKISNGIMCGTDKNNFYLMVCLENGKWVTKSKEVSNFALDSDHVVAVLKNLDLSVAAFP
eukprot:NODE_271_length_12205_cov_0.703205.p12 type:complete len:111 gc:universal NODE_271_length_12205_cov_0.703205:384-52(-)